MLMTFYTSPSAPATRLNLLSAWLVHLYRDYKARQRAGQLVGPPVPVTDEVPLPPDDLHPATHPASAPAPPPAAPEPPVLTVISHPEPTAPLVVEVTPAEPVPHKTTLAPESAP